MAVTQGIVRKVFSIGHGLHGTEVDKEKEKVIGRGGSHAGPGKGEGRLSNWSKAKQSTFMTLPKTWEEEDRDPSNGLNSVQATENGRVTAPRTGKKKK